jgi:hypothetical protein
MRGSAAVGESGERLEGGSEDGRSRLGKDC